MTTSLVGEWSREVEIGTGHRWWTSLLNDCESQRVSASNQKLRFMSRWLQEGTVSKSSSSVTKRPLGGWLARLPRSRFLDLGFSFLHLGLHGENEAVGSGGVGFGVPAATPVAEKALLLVLWKPLPPCRACRYSSQQRSQQKKKTDLWQKCGVLSVCLFLCFYFIFCFCVA